MSTQAFVAEVSAPSIRALADWTDGIVGIDCPRLWRRLGVCAHRRAAGRSIPADRACGDSDMDVEGVSEVFYESMEM